jgi:membrane protease YdiL (CAAX protease family)
VERAVSRLPLFGVALLAVAIPVLRDLAVTTNQDDREFLTVGSYLALLGIAIGFARVSGFTLAEVGLRRPMWSSIAIGLVAGLMLIVPVLHRPSVAPVTAGWLGAAVSVEEIVFRGVIFAAFLRGGGLLLAIGGSTLAFALAHAGAYGWPALAIVALLGLYLGILRALTRGCWAPGIAHLLMDLMSLP